MLQYLDFTQQFILTTDTSNVTIGYVLSKGNAGSDLAIAYASWTLNQSEINCSTFEKELLGIIWERKTFPTVSLRT